MLINNLNPLDVRSDKGALWENFLIAERIKYQHYHLRNTQNYFWRNIQKQKIDFVESKDGTITRYEFKWKGKGKKLPPAFLKGYEAQGHVIDRENFRSFVMP